MYLFITSLSLSIYIYIYIYMHNYVTIYGAGGGARGPKALGPRLRDARVRRRRRAGRGAS